jgi:hypothetical protein
MEESSIGSNFVFGLECFDYRRSLCEDVMAVSGMGLKVC